MTRTTWYFKRVSLFGQLTAEKLRRLESKSSFCAFQKNQSIFLPRGHEDDVLLVAKGRVDLRIQDPSISYAVPLAKGDLLGGIDSEMSGNEPSSVTTRTSAEFVLIPKKALHELIESPMECMPRCLEGGMIYQFRGIAFCFNQRTNDCRPS